MKILKNTIATLFAMMALMIATHSNATELKMKTFAILAFDGGESLKLAHNPIHFQVDDMQIVALMLLTS